jgi:hypothetical protein
MAMIKTEAAQLLKKMPDDSIFADIQYNLYVLEKIKKSKQSIKKHGIIPHEEVEKQMKKWIIE